ncbi:hypothetical protein NQ318_003267 [Aromia moschata]|uniref:Uncharacterized protein n=1 Tax=Aromia moschata TaxID=1265417 RepID=A0AAV8XQ53_9CUCU|nr:hypothetical protein NQ318_003267 [Aromia moschata]
MFLTKNTTKAPLAKFQLNLIRQTLESIHCLSLFIDILLPKKVTQPRIRELDVMRLTQRHFLALVPATPKTKNPLRRCTVCSQTKRGPKKRKE